MNTLFIVNDPTLFDPRSAARARMRRYAETLGSLHVLSCAGADAKDVEDGPLTLHAGRGSKLRSVFTFPMHARRLIREHRIEVVSAQDPFEHGWVALAAARGTRARVHVQIHTDFLSPFFARASSFHRARVRLASTHVLPRAHAIRVVSHRIRRSLGDRNGVSSPLPVGVPAVAPAAAALPPHDFSFVCMAIGRLVGEKRYGDLFCALARVRARHPRVGLIVAGDGPLRHRLERLVRRLRLGDAVIFLGHRHDARCLLASADGFVQASAYEGYGLTLVEAALAGVPIVTTEVGIVGEVLHAGRHALVCPVGDVAGLAAQVTRLVEDDKVRESVAREAKAAADAHLASLGDEASYVADDLFAAARGRLP